MVVLELNHGDTLPPIGTHVDPSPVDFGAPYDDEDADIIIRSSDAVDFRLQKLFLVKASRIFKELLLRRSSNSQPSPTGSQDSHRWEQKGDVAVLCLPEDRNVLESLLSLVLPVSPVIPTSLELVMPLLGAATKYQMHSAISVIRRLEQISSDNPFRVYSLAWRFRLRGECLMAVRLSLDRPLTIEGLGEDLCLFSGQALLELVNCRSRSNAVISDALRLYRVSKAAEASTPVSTQISSPEVSSDSSHKKSKKSVSQKNADPGPWLQQYLSRCESDTTALNRRQLYFAFHDHLRAHGTGEDSTCSACADVSADILDREWAAVEDALSGAMQMVSDMISFEEATPQQATSSVSVQALGWPFTADDADLILRSSDLVDFRVYKSSLRASSIFFRDMLSLPQPSESLSQNGNQTLPIIAMAEDSQTLHDLLSVLMHASPMYHRFSVTEAINVLAAAQKYQMEGLMTTIRSLLQDPKFAVPPPIGPGTAFTAYALACKHQLAEEALQAARSTLEFPFTLESCGGDLSLASGDALRVAPLLLRLSWQEWPLFHSREHGWTFRVSQNAAYTTRQTPIDFHDPADEVLQAMGLQGGHVFYKVPHKDGESANVGSPLGKTFIKYAQDGTLTSPGDEAKNALDMNAQCSYWISARDRVMKQMVVWQNRSLDMGMPAAHDTDDAGAAKKLGVIIPQVITMGTVTRRAIEKTWLTASNAKKNRVGSELKAMVRAPDGYAIVGADVDSEEPLLYYVSVVASVLVVASKWNGST
ncbi:hypothetical protein FA95DRAFT_1611749 [Auriscalpium vulgare]|uniref:Uncharacterized protein n=1 Tax=Auriscalpium vulgare TaxID=40419 RepID=A0ACB8RA79_9AGAM|nr:hypothetical protein FA95DRAFT_1611749 [Auriscalpium vulgare]